MSNHISTGTRVTGTYLGHAVTGVVKNVESTSNPAHKRYQVMLDEPVDVATSEHMTVLRRSLHMTMDLECHTVNHKGERDGIAEMMAAD